MEALSALPEDEVCGLLTAKLFQALALREAGRPEGTLEQIQVTLSYYRVCGFVLGVVFILQFLGNTSLADGDYTKAREYLREGLLKGYSNCGKLITSEFFESLAALASTKGEFTQCVTLSAAHETQVGLPFAEHTINLINTARARLDTQALASAEAAGRAVSYDQAVAYALST